MLTRTNRGDCLSINGDSLDAVVESVQDRIASRNDWGHGSDAQTAFVVSCSTSNCRGHVWPVDATWNVVGVQTFENQPRDNYEGRAVLGGNIDHLTTQYGITAALLVGHTKCVVHEGAPERWAAPDSDSPAGIEARLALLRSLV